MLKLDFALRNNKEQILKLLQNALKLIRLRYVRMINNWVKIEKEDSKQKENKKKKSTGSSDKKKKDLVIEIKRIHNIIKSFFYNPHSLESIAFLITLSNDFKKLDKKTNKTEAVN